MYISFEHKITLCHCMTIGHEFTYELHSHKRQMRYAYAHKCMHIPAYFSCVTHKFSHFRRTLLWRSKVKVSLLFLLNKSLCNNRCVSIIKEIIYLFIYLDIYHFLHVLWQFSRFILSICEYITRITQKSKTRIWYIQSSFSQWSAN